MQSKSVCVFVCVCSLPAIFAFFYLFSLARCVFAYFSSLICNSGFSMLVSLSLPLSCNWTVALAPNPIAMRSLFIGLCCGRARAYCCGGSSAFRAIRAFVFVPWQQCARCALFYFRIYQYFIGRLEWFSQRNRSRCKWNLAHTALSYHFLFIFFYFSLLLLLLLISLIAVEFEHDVFWMWFLFCDKKALRWILSSHKLEIKETCSMCWSTHDTIIHISQYSWSWFRNGGQSSCKPGWANDICRCWSPVVDKKKEYSIVIEHCPRIVPLRASTHTPNGSYLI